MSDLFGAIQKENPEDTFIGLHFKDEELQGVYFNQWENARDTISKIIDVFQSLKGSMNDV